MATCESGTCSGKPAPPKTPCTDNGGMFCDGVGQCVGCIEDKDCANITPSSCEGSFFTDSPKCDSGTCMPGVKTDCAPLACKPDGCKVCVADADCGPQGGCELNKCESGLCTKTPVLQGGPCSQAGGNTCNASGTCIAARYVFVTSLAVHSNFGGTQYPDGKCNFFAMQKGLGGKWGSWTSSSLSSASDRLMPPTAAPYRLLNDMIVANDWAGLTSGTLIHPIDLDENKAPLSGVDVWTGTKPDGTYAGASCGDWTVNSTTMSPGVLGNSGATSGEWTTKDGMCIFTAHFYCFQK